MLFNSIHYLIFAPIVIILFFTLPKSFQKYWLLLVSFYFYAVFKVPFLSLLIMSIVVTYYSVMGMVKSEQAEWKKFYLTLAVLSNLLILYLFKYIDFSFRIFNGLFGLDPCDSTFIHPWGVILPMGISFFTLQSISYAIDVHRKTITPSKSLLDFALFISFFPQLVAGPIIRAKDLLHKFGDSQYFTKENFELGIRKIILGLFKKSLIADSIGLVIDPIYASPLEYNWVAMWAGPCLHGIQVYCDFSGYSDIAIGTAKILGYDVPENFLRPFLSRNMTEMWKRWHISFSSWLRDYVYLSLGGSRVSTFRAYFNVFITMFLSGLWHGSDWTFICWGTFHATIVIIERYLFSFEKIKSAFDSIPRLLQIFYSFIFFSFPIFYFRAKPTAEFASGLDLAHAMIARAFTFAEGKYPEIPFSLVCILGLLFFIDWILEFKPEWEKTVESQRKLTYIISGIVIGYVAILYSVTFSAQFIYFQF